jgi:RNA polymerase sigma-70 factor, ECF subfamily
MYHCSMEGVTASARAAFVAALPTAAKTELERAPDLDARLAAIWHAASTAWPTLTVAPTAFLVFVAERVSTAELLERLFVADLYLACGWLAGAVAAHQALEAGPFCEAAQFLARFSAPASTVEEAKQLARSRLFARDAGHPALAGFTGRGPLRAWLGIMLARELLQLIRKDRRLTHLETGELVGMVDEHADPETMYLKTLYGEHFRTAFTDAMRALDASDKRLLRYSIVERLTIDDLSVLAGVHRATAARRIAAARERLLMLTRDYLKDRLRVDSLELQSILRLCDGELDISVQRLLAEPAP